MCGIVGLYLKNDAMAPDLGRLLAGMLDVMSDRGPDSAGFAIYGDGASGTLKLTLRGPAGTDFAAVAASIAAAGVDVGPVVRHDTNAVLSIAEDDAGIARDILSRSHPSVTVVGEGHRMELYKEVGRPGVIAERFGLPGMAGTHAIGHTRMATESAVTTNGAHPFTTGTDQCLVHNGSLSNHNRVRRDLVREGIRFETENDSEVAAGYLSLRLRQGMSLGAALEAALEDLDGFFTFVVGTENGFGVVRDPIACKPAVMAETDDWVAFGSEYRALAGLPGIAGARLFEPEPATVYFWERA